ncbi:MAG: hypothetical protein ABIS03_00270 [Gemmatimonadaceae bacterium]
MRIRLAEPGDASGIARIYEPFVIGTPVTFEIVPPTDVVAPLPARL